MNTLRNCSENEIQSTNMLICSYRNNCLSLPAIKTEHSGRKSLRFQCATLWNKFATNKIQLSNDTSLELNRVNGVSHFKYFLKNISLTNKPNNNFLTNILQLLILDMDNVNNIFIYMYINPKENI